MCRWPYRRHASLLRRWVETVAMWLCILWNPCTIEPLVSQWLLASVSGSVSHLVQLYITYTKLKKDTFVILSLMDSSPKNENYPMIYSPLRHSRCIRHSSFRWIQSVVLRYADVLHYPWERHCIVKARTTVSGSQRLLL